MKIEDLRKLSDEELKSKIVDTKSELFEKRMQHANGNLERPLELRTLRRDIARMKTVLNERKNKGGEE